MTKPLTRRAYAKTGFENNKLNKRLCRQAGQAIGDFGMIEEGDKVMVCLSGGKDSFCLLDILLTLQSRAPIAFELIAVHVNQKQPGFPEFVLDTGVGGERGGKSRRFRLPAKRRVELVQRVQNPFRQIVMGCQSLALAKHAVRLKFNGVS